MYGKFYDSIEKHNPESKISWSRFCNGIVASRFGKYISKQNPDVVIATHPLAAVLMSTYKKKQLVNTKTIGVVTDFCILPYWDMADMDYFVTANELTLNKYRKQILNSFKLIELVDEDYFNNTMGLTVINAAGFVPALALAPLAVPLSSKFGKKEVGIVASVSGTTIKVIEGNKNDAVDYRTISLNGRYIRGYGIPNYASKATNTNNTVNSKTKVDSAKSFSRSFIGTYKTTANLRMRSGAGTSKTILVVIPKGKKVTCYGYYTLANGVRWYYVTYKDSKGVMTLETPSEKSHNNYSIYGNLVNKKSVCEGYAKSFKYICKNF